MISRPIKSRRVLPLLVLALFAVPLMAQAPVNDVTTILKQFQAATLSWLVIGEKVAQSLFAILFVIELACTFGMLLLGQADVSVWTTTFVRKFMTVGAFYALLLLGPTLMQAIIDSYTQFGQMASGVPRITAGDIFADGIEIAGALLITAVQAGVTLSILSSILMVLCAAMIGWAFVRLVKGFVMAKVESFIAISVAVIQLGWGASRYTSVYAERYVSLSMACGVKLMVFYFLVGVERNLAPGWIASAAAIPMQIGGIIPVLTLTGSIVLFCAIADPDKLVGLLFAGQPQLTGHDITNTYMPWVNAGIGAGTATVGYATGAASRAATAAASASGASGASVGAASAASANTRPAQPAPPSSNGANGNGNGASAPKSAPPPVPVGVNGKNGSGKGH